MEVLAFEAPIVCDVRQFVDEYLAFVQCARERRIGECNRVGVRDSETRTDDGHDHMPDCPSTVQFDLPGREGHDTKRTVGSESPFP